MDENAELHFLRSTFAGASAQGDFWKKKWSEDTESWKRIAGEHEKARLECEARGAAYSAVKFTGRALLTVVDEMELDHSEDGYRDLLLKAAELDKVEALRGLLAKIEKLKLEQPEMALRYGLME